MLPVDGAAGWWVRSTKPNAFDFDARTHPGIGLSCFMLAGDSKVLLLVMPLLMHEKLSNFRFTYFHAFGNTPSGQTFITDSCVTVVLQPGEAAFIPVGHAAVVVDHVKGETKGLGFKHAWVLPVFKTEWCTNLSGNTLDNIKDLNKEWFTKAPRGSTEWTKFTQWFDALKYA